MKYQNKKENGSLTLETAVVLTIFLLMMLSLYGFFFVFETRNEMAHVTLATSQSLSLDPRYYATVNKEKANITTLIKDLMNKFGNDDSDFIDKSDWKSKTESEVQELAKKRFLAYLADGNEGDADKYLKRLGVKDGWNGVDFTGTKIDEDINKNKCIHLVVTYTIEFTINPFGLGELPQKIETKSRLWE